VLSAVGGFVVGWLVPDGRDLPDEATDIGILYHRWSTPGHSLDLPVPDWGSRHPRYKTYPDAARVALPDPAGFQGLTVEEALDTRRSRRNYAADSLSMETLSRLLHAAQGITQERSGFRAAPSAGALYPIEVYPVVHDVAGLAQGIYHYAVEAHELEQLQEGDFRRRVTQAGLFQGFLGQASVCILLTAVFQRARWKYRERAYRYILLEAGHIGQNIYLAATSMGLGACAVGAFYDERYNSLLALDGTEEATLYVLSVGEAG
jgi:SagB-type dehydrogenase family enzyme